MDDLENRLFFAEMQASFAAKTAAEDISRIFILTDKNCESYCLPLFYEKFPQIKAPEVIVIDGGEASKDFSVLENIWRRMARTADRNSLLINLGGGVVTDTGGFAASVFKRGIRFVNMPTSLLAMVDAAVGGKTGVNLGSLKNQIGCFSEPLAVYIDTAFLNTLPAREMLSGFAEMIKVAAVSSQELFCQLSGVENPGDDLDDLMVRNAIFAKMDIVAADPQEKGMRKLLNFGHTAGHAFESFSLKNDENPLTHGEAVAAGMVCETLMAYEKRLIDIDDFKTITELINRFFDRYVFTESAVDELVEIMGADKKNKSGKIGFSLPVTIGDAVYDVLATTDEARAMLEKYLAL